MSALSRNDSDSMDQQQQQQQQKLSPPGPHPQQQRGRDDSSSGDSAISMQSLNDSLPQHADLKYAANANAHAAVAAVTAAVSTGSVNSSNTSNATVHQEYLEDDAEGKLRATAGGDDQYEDALRRYSADVAVHTAQMFETCYGSEGYATSSSTSERAATPTISASRKTNRSSAAHPLGDDGHNASNQGKN